MRFRYQVVELLRSHGVDPCLWAEDALSFYGVPTVLFELYLLIPDADLAKAVSILSSAPEYKQVPPNNLEMATNAPRQYFLQYWSSRFTKPPGGDDRVGVQLLPAMEFADFSITSFTTVKRGEFVYPTLPAFIESLVYQYLRFADTLPTLAYRAHVCMYLSYLAEYTPEGHAALGVLSPRSRRLWEDMLNDEIMFVKKGIDYYRGTGSQDPQGDQPP
jgi:hypothetical protein